MQHCLPRVLVLFLLFCSSWAFGQGAIKGVIQDANNKATLAGALVELKDTEFYAQTNSTGSFEINNIPVGEYILLVSVEGYESLEQPINIVAGEVNDLGVVPMLNIGQDNPDGEDIIPTIMLSDDDLDGVAAGQQSISGILNANRDVFTSKVAFAWSAARFRVRGYNSDNTTVFMNNIPMNDLESGRPTWWSWSGLNDVMRNRASTIGLERTAYAYGDMGGSSTIDSRAGSQRRGTSLTYSLSNRSYEHRVMLTHNTGLLPSGWALSASGSWRYSENGAYVKGAHFNAASYFLSVEKRTGKHSLSLTAMGAPSVRGKGGPAFQEMFDLTATNYYNPNWGYQTSGETGERQLRNSRVTTSHQPLFILMHKVNLNEKIRVTTAASYQFGIYGSTALDWYDALDPRPNYYRNLPSYIEDPIQRSRAIDQYTSDPSALQINWDRLYEVNRNSYDSLENANGIAGNTVYGNRSRYVVEQRRYDSQKANGNILINAEATDFLNIDGGLTYQFYNSRNFKVLEDLLGGDFYVDVNRFVERDSGVVGSEDSYQNDLANPNRVLKAGDRFGYDYEAYIHRGSAWAQLNFSFDKIDFFLSGQGSFTSFWRKGNVQNGQFPDNSLGKSEAKNFLNHSVKGGATYKINGRNYFFVNALHQSKAPYFRYAYVSPRTRDQVLPNLQSSTNYSFEGGYVLKTPVVKANITGYYSIFENEFFQRSFYLDRGGSQTGIGGNFVNYVMTGINKRHMGLELGGEVNLPGDVSWSAAAAIGEYVYTSRPTSKLFLDNDPTIERGEQTIYLKNFHIPNTPQLALNTGIYWRAPKFWSLSVNLNYVARSFSDMNFDRRTMQAVSVTGLYPDFQQDAVQPGTELWRSILEQEEFQGQFTADIFIRKSWKIKKLFVILSLGVNNITNNTMMRTTGFEQFRFDYETKEVDRFPSSYYYGYGINYMLNLTFRI